jgi:hypothetical protein
MIHHISIAANDPRHVADVLAELMNGRSYPFQAASLIHSWRSPATSTVP